MSERERRPRYQSVQLREIGLQARKLRVMISSRCNDEFPVNSGTSMSSVRRQLKQDIESDEEFQVFGHNIFEVWINEAEPPQGGNWTSTQVCLKAVEDCDILLCIANDNAGWASENAAIGICHQELLHGLRRAPSKVRVIRLRGDWAEADEQQAQRNSDFKRLLDERNLYRGPEQPQDEDELRSYVKLTLIDALAKLAHAGVRESHRGSAPSGESLEWNRMQFTERKSAMETALRSAVLQRTNAKEEDGHVVVIIDSLDVLLTLSAIPDSLTVSEALELVGRPFLRDHLVASALSETRVGPVHIIACFKNATESQARKLLGFPDATVVSGPFGIWVADKVQNVQFAFIVGCNDQQSVGFGVQALFDWLSDSTEDHLLATRAVSRSRIVDVIAREVRS